MHRTALVLLALAALAALVPQASAGELRGEGQTEDPTFWNTLLFDAWDWEPGGVVGFNGVALWALIFLAVAIVGFDGPLRLTAQLAGATAAFVALWFVTPLLGELTEIGLPALMGVAAAWIASRRIRSAQGALRVAFIAAVLGVFAGDLLGYGIMSLWADQDVLVFGDRRFVDEVFTVPGFALLGIVLFKVIPAVVRAIDDANDDEPSGATAGGPAQGAVFEVECLRCHTNIKVDRSMKRFRVATDRFEFACPNCQYWMEWADPSQKGAAAA